MDNRRGIIGGTMVTFVATVTIVIILLIFSIGSAVIKTVDDSAGGLKVYKLGEVGLGGVENYMVNYLKFVRARAYVNGDKLRVNDAIGRAEYVK